MFIIYLKGTSPLYIPPVSVFKNPTYETFHNTSWSEKTGKCQSTICYHSVNAAEIVSSYSIKFLHSVHLNTDSFPVDFKRIILIFDTCNCDLIFISYD
jgi:hypothetical protein